MVGDYHSMKFASTQNNNTRRTDEIWFSWYYSRLEPSRELRAEYECSLITKDLAEEQAALLIL